MVSVRATMWEYLRRIAASPSKILFCGLLAWVAGIALRSFIPGTPNETIAVSTCLAFATATIVHRLEWPPFLRLTLLCLAISGCSALRFDASLAKIAPVTTLEYRGIVLNDTHPDVSGTTIRIERLRGITPDLKGPFTSFSIRTTESLVIPAGSPVRWSCKSAPKIFGTSASCFASSITKEPPLTNPLTTAVITTRSKLRTSARSALPEPDASLILGFVIGDRDGIPKEIADAYRDTGVSHVLAASGSNVGWVVGLVAVLSAIHRISRRSALLRIAAAALFFAAIVGGDPPVARAAVVACITLTAEAFGRRAHYGIALASTAAIMLAIDPLLIRDSVAFRLSFAAIIGLATLAKPLESIMMRITERFGLRKILAETSAASLATLPIVLHDFGRLPVSSLFANAVVVPVMPWLVASGSLTIAIALIWPPLSLPFAIAFSTTLRLIDAIIATFARLLPAITLTISTFVATFMYVAIFIFRHLLILRMRSQKPPQEIYD